MLPTHTGGMINRIFQLGSADGKKFLLRFPGDKKEGNYSIQHTPHELASLIACLRSEGKKCHKVLVVGPDTFGAERFICEIMGALEVDVVIGAPDPSDTFEKNVAALELGGCKVHVSLRNLPIDTDYDLILLSGNDQLNMDSILEKTKIGTLFACLGTGVRADKPNLRKAWFTVRNSGHRGVLQSGAGFGEVGLGLLVITHKKEKPEVPLPAMEVKDDDNHRNVDADQKAKEPVEAGTAGNTEEAKAEVREQDSERDGSGSKGANAETIPVKKKPGRKPGSKNKVKI